MEPVCAHKGRKHPADSGGACATGPAHAAKARQADGSISAALARGPDCLRPPCSIVRACSPMDAMGTRSRSLVVVLVGCES